MVKKHQKIVQGMSTCASNAMFEVEWKNFKYFIYLLNFNIHYLTGFVWIFHNKNNTCTRYILCPSHVNFIMFYILNVIIYAQTNKR